MAWGGEAFHKHAGLRDDRLRRGTSDAGDGLQQQNLPLPRTHRLLDPAGHLFQEFGELVNQAQVLAAQGRVVLAEAALQRIDEFGDTGAQAALGPISQRQRVPLPLRSKRR